MPKSMTDVERLVEKVGDKLFTAFRPHVSDGMCDVMAKEVLRIFLKEVQDGEVAVVGGSGYVIATELKIVLKPSFKEFAEGN